MAFDGNGNWVSNFNAEEDRDNNIKILASRFDNIFIADIQQSFENCLTKDMQIKPQGNFDANSNRVINVADPVNNNDAANKQTVDSAVSSAISTMLSSLYPVGSLYIGTQSTCPLETLISGSTWTIVATNRALWGGDGTNADTTIEAGLPNITGYIQYYCAIYNYGGAFKRNTSASLKRSGAGGSDTYTRLDFNAGNSNSIYGKSTTVQPPAYRVNVWKRTA